MIGLEFIRVQPVVLNLVDITHLWAINVLKSVFCFCVGEKGIISVNKNVSGKNKNICRKGFLTDEFLLCNYNKLYFDFVRIKFLLFISYIGTNP